MANPLRQGIPLAGRSGRRRLTALALASLFASACADDAAPEQAVVYHLPNPEAADDTEVEARFTAGQVATDWQADGEWMVSPPLVISDGLTQIGALIELADAAPTDAGGEAALPTLHIESQLLKNGRVTSPWRKVPMTFDEGHLRVAAVAFSARGDAAQLRVRADQLDFLRKLQWTGAAPDDAAPSAGLGVQGSPLTGALQGLGIVERATWGARKTKCTTLDSKRTRMAIHHTETYADKPAVRVRAIQAYHMDGRGWCDIGYHFLIGADGSIYEGRPYALLGAHTGGQNSGNVGISFVGCFHDKGCAAMPPTNPPEAMLKAAARLMGTLHALEGIVLDADHVKGHRDHKGASTDCPGAYLYAKLGLLIGMSHTMALGDMPSSDAADAGSADAGSADAGSADASNPDASDPGPDTTPVEPTPVACKDLACGDCSPAAGCAWCASKGVCQDSAGTCAWAGYVGLTSCWATLWPCAVGTCWNPKTPLAACGAVEIDEDFSSGKYNVHRYWTTLPAGAPVQIQLQRKTGSWQPALIVTDQAGTLIAGGDVAKLHPLVHVEAAISGRSGGVSEVTLSALVETQVLVLATSWAALDGGFLGKIPQTATYHLRLAQQCAATTPTPVPTAAQGLAAIHDGLSREGMEIPRAGLANTTLQSVFGLGTEPYGNVTSFAGLQWVEGAISEFGGPKDTGVSATETGAISGEVLRKLNDPLNPTAQTLAANPSDYYYIAMRFNYQPAGKAWWKSARIVVANPQTGKAIVVRPVDWGPNYTTKRVGDLSPQALVDLGLTTDDDALFAFAKPGSALGVVPAP